MSRPTLIIANRNYSSWSLRAWLALEATGVEFDEVVVPLGTPATVAEIRRWPPSGRLPAYRDGEILLWDLLAICDHLVENHPGARLGPEDPIARATARDQNVTPISNPATIGSSAPVVLRRRSPACEPC